MGSQRSAAINHWEVCRSCLCFIHSHNKGREQCQGELYFEQDLRSWIKALRAAREDWQTTMAPRLPAASGPFSFFRFGDRQTMRHTPGPWVHCTDGFPKPDVRASNGRAVAITWMVCSNTPKNEASYRSRCEQDRANATRIVSCVNACEGINPEAVQDLLEVCEAALRISELWLPSGEVSPEHHDECAVLSAMHLKLKAAVKKARSAT